MYKNLIICDKCKVEVEGWENYKSLQVDYDNKYHLCNPCYDKFIELNSWLGIKKTIEKKKKCWLGLK